MYMQTLAQKAKDVYIIKVCQSTVKYSAEEQPCPTNPKQQQTNTANEDPKPENSTYYISLRPYLMLRRPYRLHFSSNELINIKITCTGHVFSIENNMASTS